MVGAALIASMIPAANATPAATQENVRLVVLERNNAVFLHDFEGPQTLRLRPLSNAFQQLLSFDLRIEPEPAARFAALK